MFVVTFENRDGVGNHYVAECDTYEAAKEQAAAWDKRMRKNYPHAKPFKTTIYEVRAKHQEHGEHRGDK